MNDGIKNVDQFYSNMALITINGSYYLIIMWFALCEFDNGT